MVNESVDNDIFVTIVFFVAEPTIAFSKTRTTPRLRCAYVLVETGTSYKLISIIQRTHSCIEPMLSYHNTTHWDTRIACSQLSLRHYEK
jgi:hypothetical protein